MSWAWVLHSQGKGLHLKPDGMIIDDGMTNKKPSKTHRADVPPPFASSILTITRHNPVPGVLCPPGQAACPNERLSCTPPAAAHRNGLRQQLLWLRPAINTAWRCAQCLGGA